MKTTIFNEERRYEASALNRERVILEGDLARKSPLAALSQADIIKRLDKHGYVAAPLRDGSSIMMKGE